MRAIHVGLDSPSEQWLSTLAAFEITWGLYRNIATWVPLLAVGLGHGLCIRSSESPQMILMSYQG